MAKVFTQDSSDKFWNQLPNANHWHCKPLRLPRLVWSLQLSVAFIRARLIYSRLSDGDGRGGGAQRAGWLSRPAQCNISPPWEPCTTARQRIENHFQPEIQLFWFGNPAAKHFTGDAVWWETGDTVHRGHRGGGGHRMTGLTKPTIFGHGLTEVSPKVGNISKGLFIYYIIQFGVLEDTPPM